MLWIKAHLNVVVAGAVGLLALVALILGVVLPDPAAPLRGDAALFSSLQNPAGASRNAFVELQTAQAANSKKIAEMLRNTAVVGEHKPLPVADDLFPKENPNAQNAPFEFKRAFEAARKDLLAMLKAQGPPTEQEILAQREIIIAHHTQQTSEKDTTAKPLPGGRNLIAPRNVLAGNRPFNSPLAGGGTGLQPGQLPPLSPNPTPEELVQKVPECRAAVDKARRIWCYATLENLDQRPAITDPSVQRPQLDEMWYAQMSLWIQQDILGALHRLNEKRAGELSDEKAWVGNLPFKRLIAFTVGGYVPPATAAATGAGRGGSGTTTDGLGGSPPMDGSAVLTRRGSTPTVDIVQFTIEMIVEARSLPEILDQISSSGFYTVLQVGYEAVPPNFEMRECIYGSQPVIRVWLLVEGAFLRTSKEYESRMPEEVKKAIEQGRPVGGGAGAGSGTGGMRFDGGFPRGGGGGGLRRLVDEP